MKSSIGIALSVSNRPVPLDPSSSETRAIVVSSGASTMLTKSNRPRTDHWALTVAPSCSTSVLTSRMRCGLFLTVWTPSGVRVDSMMNVGMRPFYQSLGSNAIRLLLAALLLVALAGPASAAAAPAIQTDRACYLDTPQTTVTVTGNGFAPYTSYTASLDGQPLGGATTNGQGAIQAAIKPSALADGEHERDFHVEVAPDQPAATTFSVTRFLATFAPVTGDAGHLRVRFSCFCF